MTMVSRSMPTASGGDVEEFIDKVDDVARLIACLREGTISPEYVDRKLEERAKFERVKVEAAAPPIRPDVEPAGDNKKSDEARQEELRRKVEVIKASLERKRKARERYQAHVSASSASGSSGTDYNKWDMWCPSDDEDDMIKNLTPNSAEFRSMEKDIDERHARMVQQRQIAERERVKGNALFKEKRYTEAYQCYEIGLSHEKPNMALHANAAMASIKMKCFVQAVTHCDKVLSIAEFLHNNKKDALCAKALHRRAVAYKALQQPRKAVDDLKAALAIQPANPEVAKDLARAERDLEQHNKKKRVLKVVQQDNKGTVGTGMQELLSKLQQVEQQLAAITRAAPSTTSKVAEGGALPKGGPALPQRTPAQSWGVIGRACKELKGLLDADEGACIYFQELNGINVVTALVCAEAQPGAAPAAAASHCNDLLWLLTAACLYDGNMAAAAQNAAFLQACIDLVAGRPAKPSSAQAAAALLMFTLSTMEVSRQLLSSALCSGNTKASKAAEAGPPNSTGVQRLLDCLPCMSASVQVDVLSLLGNCASDKAVQLQLCSDMRAPSSWEPLASCAASDHPLTAQRALAALGNLCTDPVLRQKMCSPNAQIISTLLPLAVPKPSGSVADDTQLAALGALYNLALEPNAQQQFSAADVAGLLHMLQLSVSSSSSSSSHLKAQLASALLSRVAQNAALLEVLQTGKHTLLLLSLLSEQLQRQQMGGSLSDSEPLGVPSSTGAPDAGSRHVPHTSTPGAPGKRDRGTIEHLVRVVARCLTQAGTPIPCLAAAAAAGGLSTLLDLMAEPFDSSQAIQGNAALAVSTFAAHQQFWRQLRELSAVAKLIRIAHRGQGNTASKNAAIALARMAHDSAMLDNIRELHGIEIIYQYVKP